MRGRTHKLSLDIYSVAACTAQLQCWDIMLMQT